ETAPEPLPSQPPKRSEGSGWAVRRTVVPFAYQPPVPSTLPPYSATTRSSNSATKTTAYSTSEEIERANGGGSTRYRTPAPPATVSRLTFTGPRSPGSSSAAPLEKTLFPAAEAFQTAPSGSPDSVRVRRKVAGGGAGPARNSATSWTAPVGPTTIDAPGELIDPGPVPPHPWNRYPG